LPPKQVQHHSQNCQLTYFYRNVYANNRAPNLSVIQPDNGRSRSNTIGTCVSGLLLVHINNVYLGGPAPYANAPQIQPAQPKKKIVRLAGGGVLEVDDYSSGGPSVISSYPQQQNSAPPPRPQTTNYGQSINYNNYKQYVAPSATGLAPPPINRQSKIITTPLQYDPQFNQYNNGPQQPVQMFQPNNAPSLPPKAQQNYPVDNGTNFVSPRADSAPVLLPNQPKQIPKQPPKQMAKNPNGVGPKKIQMPKQPAPTTQPSPNQFNSPLSNSSSPLISPNSQPVPLSTGPNYNHPSPMQPNYQAQPKQHIVNIQPQNPPPNQPVQMPAVQPPQQIVISEPDEEPKTSPEPGGKRPLTLGELYKLKNQAKQQRSRDTSPQK
jgi:hypothetical protein